MDNSVSSWATALIASLGGAAVALMGAGWRARGLVARVDANEKQTAENKEEIKELREAVHHIDVTLAGMGSSLKAIQAAVAPNAGGEG